ncbi:MAG: small multi-drug export protein [Candidatus Marinimicrobia bacterium]|nr:small multi-drug export protein [Candidatus Neomarinimicrobiota bacterium]MCF7922894.1 small multi-drug export protein [Candidatus Neomarinimicrobiota bacterium]
MLDAVIHFFQGFVQDPRWITFLLAMTPIGELRVALPWGMTIGDMLWYDAFIWAVAGNFLISIPILLLLGPVSKFLMRWPLGERFFNWLFARTRRKGKMIETWEFLGLVIFVGIPLPVTGAWTGAAAAFLFGLSYRKSFLAIFAGLLMSATIVTIITTTGVKLFG